ncbi:FAD-dependent oxidoreductase [Psychromonas ossibalaenae]|uniref:FAD-dependent oxidoreductase n=1 Tax=Psychromonas ossibalaenae TaxID=444922 RepID=UPI000382DE81|nr:FAD-dependent oxidoreductase [Psychromonas ossibalaenae]
MTAIDIAVQSKKLGAEEVTIAYRRDKKSMGASPHEQELAHKNDISFIYNVQPQKVTTSQAGITAIEFNRTRIDSSGKLTPTDTILSLPCDVVFKAVGQHFENSSLSAEEEQPRLNQQGRIAVDDNYQTSLTGVYAGGDCINGKDLVVEAVNHGTQAALAIHQQLQQD